MRQIKLSRGKFAIVSDKDYEELTKYNWHYSSIGYAVRNVRIDVNKYDCVYMHRQLMGLTKGDGLLVDHVNGDTLDNRRENLRVCTKTENQCNQRPRHTRASIYKGVGWYKRDKKWRARISVNKTNIEIGKFTCETCAARAYNEAAQIHHGEFAWLNDVPDGLCYIEPSVSKGVVQ
jgi:hypothetical protein